MKVVILAGGFGTRITEESHLKPKPMVEIGGYPILWHIMKLYSAQGFNEFIICLGYKGFIIKEYFANYFLRHSDLVFDFSSGRSEISTLQHSTEPWRVTLVDTGLHTMTGGRLRRVKQQLDGQPFMMTYGDGVSNVDLSRLIAQHRGSAGNLATLTAVQPSGRFGALAIDENSKVTAFNEKPRSGWINGGFYVFSPEIFDLLESDDSILEERPMQTLAAQGALGAYRHDGFWHPMDTMRDRNLLEDLWVRGEAPWKIW